MLKDNMLLNVIIKYTSLTKKAIEKLKTKLNNKN